jgi:hypothetical protein
MSGISADLQDQKVLDLQKRQKVAEQSEIERLSQTIPQDQEVPGPELPGPTQGGEPLMGSTLQKATAADRAKWALQARRVPSLTKSADKILEDSLIKDPDSEAERILKLTLGAQVVQGKKDVAQTNLSGTKYKADAGTENAMIAAMAKIYGIDKNEAAHRYRTDRTFEAAAARTAQMADAAKLRASQNGTKPLSDKVISQIDNLTGNIARQDHFDENFDPSTMLGPSQWINKARSSWFGETLGFGSPEAEKATEWWRDFKSMDNVERHELFGAAITAGEEAAWKATTVNPWDGEAKVRNAIRRRREIQQGILDRITRMHGMDKTTALNYARQIGLQGYETGEKGVENQFRNEVTPQAASEESSRAVTPVVVPEGGVPDGVVPYEPGKKYESGTKVLTPDGKIRIAP